MVADVTLTFLRDKPGLHTDNPHGNSPAEGGMAAQRGVQLAEFWPRAAAQLLDLIWMLPLGMLLVMLGEFARGGQGLSSGADLMLQKFTSCSSFLRLGQLHSKSF